MQSLPSRERGLKLCVCERLWGASVSLPSRERGLKLYRRQNFRAFARVAPLAGAWIEILFSLIFAPLSIIVAPLAGAWIEISALICRTASALVAPLAGAWIEISVSRRLYILFSSLPSRERGLKSDVSAMVCR